MSDKLGNLYEMAVLGSSGKAERSTSRKPANGAGVNRVVLAVDRRPARSFATVMAIAATVAFAAIVTVGSAQAMDWSETKQLVRTEFPEAPQLSITGLAKVLNRQTPAPLVIDVREPEEYAVSHLPGAIHAQGSELERLVKQTGAKRPIVLYCSVGYRSSRETEKLRRKGYANVSNLEGSIFKWANAGKPLVRGGPQSQTVTDAVHPFDEAWGVLLDAEYRSYVPRAD